MTEDRLLEIRDLSVEFPTDDGVVRAVDGVGFSLHAGETLAVVGESGCGKSVTAMSILRLIESQRGRISGGHIVFEGRDLLQLDAEAMRRVRGNEIAMVFQEPMTSLNPVYTVGDQIGEVLRVHRGLDGERAAEEAVRLLRVVQMPDAEQRAKEYPHQLSGGMRQRVMIAMALSCSPKILVADEPTTALDVTVQAQILELLRSLQEQLKMAVLLITHDLGVVASFAHRVVVMYAGQVVESSPTEELFDAPRHPYTAGLLASIPSLDGRRPLTPIEGSVPDALDFPRGCRFHPRCALRFEPCDHEAPILKPVGREDRSCACFYQERTPTENLLQVLSHSNQDAETCSG